MPVISSTRRAESRSLQTVDSSPAVAAVESVAHDVGDGPLLALEVAGVAGLGGAAPGNGQREHERDESMHGRESMFPVICPAVYI